MTYYKATRTDGTDFRTGTILYEVGKRVRPAPHDGSRSICGPGYLHASDVPTETLLGGSWPCRLFEVSGKPCVGFDEHYRHKGGFKQLKVLKELPSHQALGPQGEELVALFDAIRGLDREQVRSLVAAWDAARVAAWVAARVAARDAAWDAARDAAWVAAWDAARDAAWVAAWDAARVAARDAAWDAALAILTRDLIGSGDYTQEHHDLLYGPWREVMG